MTIRKANYGLATLALLAFPTLATAGDAAREGSPLIGHQELQRRLDDPKVRLLDARPRAEYDQGHIPGAVPVDSRALHVLARVEAIRDRAAWSQALAPLGLAPEIEEVYVYDASRQHDAAQVWWLLTYAGVKKVGLVDGGFPLWERQGRPVTAETTVVAPREFTPEFRAERLATREDVRQAVRREVAQLLDARSTEEYRGETTAGDRRSGGHIPTARSLDGHTLIDADGRFLDPREQRRLLAESGIAADRPVIAYSHGGARSAIVVFALERLGVPARHYVPGLADWSRDPQAPIRPGIEPGRAIE